MTKYDFFQSLDADHEPDAPGDHVDTDKLSDKENKKTQQEKKRGQTDSATPQKPQKRAKRANAFEKAVQDFIDYQRESDEKFLDVFRESNTDSAASSPTTMAEIVSTAVAETLGKLAQSQFQSFNMQF